MRPQYEHMGLIVNGSLPSTGNVFFGASEADDFLGTHNYNIFYDGYSVRPRVGMNCRTTHAVCCPDTPVTVPCDAAAHSWLCRSRRRCT